MVTEKQISWLTFSFNGMGVFQPAQPGAIIFSYFCFKQVSTLEGPNRAAKRILEAPGQNCEMRPPEGKDGRRKGTVSFNKAP